MLVLSLFATLVTPAHANDCDTWKWVAPLPGVFHVEDMATDGSLVVAVGSDKGRVAVSTDATEWSFVETGVAQWLHAIAHNGTDFVAVGYGTGAAKSADGLSWTVADTGASFRLVDVVWTGSLWAAVGGDEIATSANGIDWTVTSVPGAFDLYAVGHASGQYVVAGSSKFVATSPDGSAWTTRDTGAGGAVGFESLAWDGAQWLLVGASGTYYTSADAIGWTARSYGASFPSRVRWHGDRFVVTARDGMVHVSENGVDWASHDTGSTSWLHASVTFGSELLVGGSGSTVLASEDDANWEPRTTVVTPNYLADATRGGDRIVAVGGNGTAVTSDDGVVWTARDMQSTRNFNDVAYGNGTFVAVAGFGAVFTSADGESWTERTSGVSGKIGGVAHNGTRFVIATDDGLLSSEDGITWTPRAAQIGRGVTWGGGQFVAHGFDENGEFAVSLTSADGITWTEHTSPGFSFLWEIAYGDGLFVGGSNDGEIWTSADGISWSQRVSGTTERLIDVGYNGRFFVMIAENKDVVLTSPDGANWTDFNVGGEATLTGIGSWGTGSVLLGSSGLILTDTFAGVCAAPLADAAVEGGAALDVEVTLNRAPTDPVTVTFTPDAQVTVSPGTLDFDGTDWDLPQTLTVTAVDDAADEGPHAGTVAISAGSSDLAYDGVDVSDLVADIVDNDAAGITFVESAGSTDVVEGSATDTYTLVLNRAPASAVTVELVGDGQVETDVPSVELGTGDWDQPVTVTVSAVDDDVDEDVHTGAISHVVTSSDEDYDGLVVPDLEATIVDDDTAAMVYEHTGAGTVVGESGLTDDVTVHLATEPEQDVTVRIMESTQGAAELRIEGTNLVDLLFTSSTWNVPQSATISAVDDTDVEGAETRRLNFNALTSDSKYSALGVKQLEVQIDDDDGVTPGLVVVQVQGNGNELAEPARDLGYNVSLASRPTAPVTVTLQPDDQMTAEVTDVGGHVLTYTSDDFAIGQRVSVGVVDDPYPEGDHQAVLTVVTSSGDAAYDGLSFTYTFDVTDDDVGMYVDTPAGGVMVVEGGATDTYEVGLTEAPSAAVTVTLTADDQVTVAPTTIEFTPSDLGPATVTVTAVDDTVYEGRHTGTVSHDVQSDDGVFDASVAADVVATVVDDEVPPDTGDTGDTGDSGDTGDTESPDDTGEEPKGCGCATGTSGATLSWLLLLVAVVRARVARRPASRARRRDLRAAPRR